MKASMCAMLAILLSGVFASLVQAAPLSIPDVPPGRLNCGTGWQTSQRVAGFDGGAGYLIDTAYDQATRAGRLLRRPFGNVGDALAAGAPAWEAGALLDGRLPATRHIFTLDGSGRTVPLGWAGLDAGLQAALDPAGDGLGEARLAYVLGDRSREDAPFRRRASLLGDIVRATPLLVAAPAATGASAAMAGFVAFHQRYRDRPRLVYAGANDAMLHAFGWDDGVERFAYLPRALLPTLPRFTNGAAHYVGVDAAPGQGDALVDGQWRSVLAAGMGMGARGLFALDVTDPQAGPAALWEFGERDDPAIGHVHAPPQIVKLAVGSTSGARGIPVYRYFVLTTSGIDGAGGVPALFLLALDKPSSAPWRHGANYFRLDATDATDAADGATATLLAPPVVTVGADGSARSAYAGDLQGVMWRFELEGLARPGAAAARAGTVLFRARADDGAAQAITAPASVVFAPGGGYLVLFGTGRAIEAADLEPASFVQQSMYAVRDAAVAPVEAVAGRSALAQRRLIENSAGGFTVEGARFDYKGEGSAVKQGWFVDFPRSLAEGERLAAAPALSGTAVVVNTAAPGQDRCNSAQRSYVLDSVSGLSFDRRGLPVLGTPGGGAVPTGKRTISPDGVLPMLLSRAAGAEVATPTGAVRARRSLVLYQLPPAGTGAAVQLEQLQISQPSGRLSWREIANWRELHEAASARPPSSR